MANEQLRQRIDRFVREKGKASNIPVLIVTIVYRFACKFCCLFIGQVF